MIMGTQPSRTQPPADKQQDERVALGLSQAAEAGMELTMREHLEAL